MAFEGINGKLNKNVIPGQFGIKQVDVKETKEVKETEETQVVFKGQTEASALTGLEIQGRSVIAKSTHAQDIKECKELASLLPKGLEGVNKYFTPLNFASVAKVTKEADKTLSDAVTFGNIESLFNSPEFEAFENFFA